MIKRVLCKRVTGSCNILGYIHKKCGLGPIESKKKYFFPLKWHFIGLNFLSQFHKPITNNP